MDLQALTVFLVVARERSFSRAAVSVGKAQPAVSQAVRRLEEQVCVQLFDRNTKAPQLTEAGRVLQDCGDRLFRLVEETQSAISQLRDLRGGRILIGSNEAAVHSV